MSEENYLERMDRQFAEEQRFNRHIRGEIINAAVAVESSIEEIIACISVSQHRKHFSFL